MTRHSPTPAVVPILSAANFVIGLGAFVVIGILNPMAETFGLSPSEAGNLMVVYAGVYAISSPLLVSATGRIGRRRILAVATGLFALAALISALAPTAPVLFAARVLSALSAGMVTPVAAAVAAGLSPPGKQGAALSMVFLGFSLSQVIGVPLGSFLAYTFGWRIAFALVVALAVPCAVLIWVRVPAGLHFAPVGLPDLMRVVGNWRLMLAVSFTTLFLSGSYVVFTYLAPLLSETMGFARNGITAVLTLSGLGAVAGSLMGGKLTDRIGAQQTLVLLCLAQMAVTPMFSTLPLPVFAVMALPVLWSLFGWSFMPAQQVRLIIASPQNANVLLALNAGAVYLGAAAGSAIGGALIERSGLWALGLGGGACVCAALAVLLMAGGWRGPRSDPAAPSSIAA
ncbi:MFS transporter [Pseudodonghicola flavimaris]|uniref:MFS transporter n=1 Tax=Pseudodonghicola flavimaris TaxID=3050036 RepID=A0ABT7F6U9_9RHOB|nr:MFS transporter [Pseudodonghicola flavimaris]MDK3020332.1 MFS transporter [Pseudodonghicola flavimaris]